MRRQRSCSRSANQAPQYTINPNTRLRQDNYAALGTNQAVTAEKVTHTRLLRPPNNIEEPADNTDGYGKSGQQCPLSQMNQHLGAHSPNQREIKAEVGKGLLNASPIHVGCGQAQTKKDKRDNLCCKALPLDLTPVVHGPPVLAGTQPRYEVYMRCVTWSRDSHGLFDYESKNIAKKNIKTQTGGKILRVGDDVEFVSIRTKPEEVDANAKPMIIVRQRDGEFTVQNDTLVAMTPRDAEGNPVTDEDINNKMFVVVRNTKSAQNNLDYKLCRGDVVKLGRIKFNVKDYKHQVHTTNKKQKAEDFMSPQKGDNSPERCCDHQPSNLVTNITPVKNANPDHSQDSLREEFEEEAVEIDCGVVDPQACPDIQCKVCWDNSSTRENPLLNSCQCDGSVRYIHYECLKYWLKQKMVKKEEPNLISYTWKQFECEICKKPYPYVFKSNGVSYRLVDVESDIPVDKNYLLLESLTFEKNSSRMVHLIMPDAEKTVFKLGRGHESDVRVSDISVSRCHALLKFNDQTGRFYLEDNLSKFGTLVLSKSNIPLEPDLTKAVQIGRSVISFTVKPYSPPTVTQSQMKAVTAKKEVKAIEASPDIKCTKIAVTQASPMKQHQATVEEMLRKRIEETNEKISQLMQTAMVPNQIELEEQPGFMGMTHDNAEVQANFDHLVRATNHLKLAQAEFEQARKVYRPEPEGVRTTETQARGQGTPGGQSFLYRANSQINDANDCSGGLGLHAQPTAFQGGKVVDHGALRAQEPIGNVSDFYAESSGDIEEESKEDLAVGGLREATAHFGDMQPLRAASKMGDPAAVQRQNSSDNPPILQMLRLHKQQSDKKQRPDGYEQSEQDRLMLTRQDEMLAAQAQFQEVDFGEMRDAERFGSQVYQTQSRGKSMTEPYNGQRRFMGPTGFTQATSPRQKVLSNGPALRNAFANDSRDPSEGGQTTTSMGPSAQSLASAISNISMTKKNSSVTAKAINISPVKKNSFKNPGVTEYCEKGSYVSPISQMHAKVVDAHNRLRDFQNSQGKSSQALFGQEPSASGDMNVGKKNPTSSLQSKTASAFGQNMRF